MFKIIGEHDRKLEFEINGVDVSIVNCVRRVILAEYPTVAIAFDPYIGTNNDITFEKNTSALHNEILGHRISLLPVHLDTIGFDPMEFSFRIDVTNRSKEGLWVTSKDIVVYRNGDLTTSHDWIFPPDRITGDHILITKLKPNVFEPDMGESVSVLFRARVGISKTHARWSPVSLCAFSNQLDTVQIQDRIRKCPELMTDNKFQTLDKYRLFLKNAHDEPDHFNFIIESECSVKPGAIFEQALQVIKNKLRDLEFTSRCCDGVFTLDMANQDHTMGNLLQAFAVNEHIRKQDRFGLRYIGYHQPHPLESNIVIKLAFDSNEITEVDNFIGQLSSALVNCIDEIQVRWSLLQRNNIVGK